MQIQKTLQNFETFSKNTLNVDAKHKLLGKKLMQRNIAPASGKRAESIISP
jgi:hypothetical protein